MRILYLGLPLGALCLAEAGYPPVAMGLGHPDAPGARRLRRRLGAGTGGAMRLLLGRPDLGDPAVRRTLAACRPDALLSWFWPRRIPPDVLSMAPRGAFGVHPSLLPRWRGPDPYFWALRAGDRETGVTLHRLEADYDTGPIVAREVVPIAPDDDAYRLARRLDRPSLALLTGCARALAAGETLEGTPQIEAEATDAPMPDAEALAIDWRVPAEDVLRLVRAAAPEPGATAALGVTEVEVMGARPAAEPPPRALLPSEAWRSAEGLAVCTGDHRGVLLTRVRLPDGRAVDGEALMALVHGRTP